MVTFVVLGMIAMIAMIVAIYEGYRMTTLVDVNTKASAKATTVAFALLALAFFAGATVSYAASVNNGSAANGTTDEVATVDDGSAVNLDDLDDARVELTVDLDQLQVDQWDSVSYVLLEYSLSTYDRERTQAAGFSDAVSMPFSSVDEDGARAELAEEILRNPVYGVGMAEFLSSIQLGQATLGELNPWMREFVRLTDENGLSYWCVYDDTDGETILVSDTYRTYAVGVCTLFERCVFEGTGTYQTQVNWCLDGAMLNSERRMAPASYEYEGKFFVFAYQGKNGEDLIVVGVNTTDKRPALIQEVVLVEEEVQTSTPSTTTVVTPPSGDNITPTPTSSTPEEPDEPTVPTTPDEPTTTVTPKDPTADPVNNGNANTGGGKNDTTDAGELEDEHSSASSGSSSTTGNNSSAGSSTSGGSTSGASSSSGSDTGSSSSGSTSFGTEAPKTDPIEPTTSTPVVDVSTGESADLAEEVADGEIAMPD